jgi:S-adenosylmethionine decarboxylase
MHVTIDGFGGDRHKLSDENLVRALLDRYPEEIGMTKIAPPHVCRYVSENPRDWGISGFVLIAESHISIHTFPEHGYVWVDVFSCKGFDARRPIDDIREQFLLAEVRTQVLSRGLEFPHTVDAAAPYATRERKDVATAVVDERFAARQKEHR